jgi:hypothetical protein
MERPRRERSETQGKQEKEIPGKFRIIGKSFNLKYFFLCVEKRKRERKNNMEKIVILLYDVKTMNLNIF